MHTLSYIENMSHNTVQELVNMIDNHLADQLSRQDISRCSSRGTMFVDWDGYNPPVVSYHYPRRPQTPPLVVTNDNMEIRYRNPPALASPEKKSQRLYVEGFDPDTGFQYDYDGKTMHVHKDGSRPSSRHSDYYALDAENFDSNAPVLVVDKDLPSIPQERKRRDKVVNFIIKVFKRLSDLGILNRIKEDHRRKMEGGPPCRYPRQRHARRRSRQDTRRADVPTAPPQLPSLPQISGPWKASPWPT